MKLQYVINARMPTEKAHGVHVASMCSEFARAGAKVELIVPRRLNRIHNNIFGYYGIESTFAVTRIPVLDLVRLGKIGYFIESFTFAFGVSSYLLFTRADWVLLREDTLTALCVSLVRKNTLLEVHKIPKSFSSLYGGMLKRVPKIVSTNEWKKRNIASKYRIDSKNILIAPNGFCEHDFNIKESQETLRERLQLPTDSKIVMYAGHLYEWKGPHILAEAAALLPRITFVFVGGSAGEIKVFQKKYNQKNIIYRKQKPHKEIPEYLKAASVLVLPNIPSTHESEYETSPIKLFEYMASGVPIVASDLPSIREIVTDEECRFVEPGNAEHLAQGIQSVFDEKGNGEERAAQARKKASAYTWQKRAERILTFITA